MCLTPLVLNRDKFDERTVPCNRCERCYARRASGWSFRLMQQDKVSISAHFVTLTYDTSHIPISDNGFTTLSPRDLQLFFKRLRKYHFQVGDRDRSVKYYAAGEYGSIGKRPHYHVILFNSSELAVCNTWNLGAVHFGDVAEASVGYTLKYISKGRWKPMHKRDDRYKEFARMSKGLGANYITPAMKKWHLNDLENRMYCMIEDGKKIAMPRYYKDRIYNDEQREIVVEAQQRRIYAMPDPKVSKIELYKLSLEKQKFNQLQKSTL